METSRSSRERFEADLRRTVERIGGLGLPRLAASFAPEATRADAAHALAQHLADLAADMTGEPHRTVPRLGDQAVADQLAVCGHDLLEAAGPTPSERDAEVLEAAADLLLDLRRRV